MPEDSKFTSGLNELAKEHKEHIVTLYSELYHCARHYHLLIWTNASLGVSLVLAAMLSFRESDPFTFTVVGFSSLAILRVFHLLAEGNRTQWKQYMQAINEIECFWKIRDAKENDHGPLIPHPEDKGFVTKNARYQLYKICAVIVLLAVCLKWYNSTDKSDGPKEASTPSVTQSSLPE